MKKAQKIAYDDIASKFNIYLLFEFSRILKTFINTKTL